MNNLERNLFLKHELKFNKNGKFKILMMSDIHETLDYNEKCGKESGLFMANGYEMMNYLLSK